MVLAVVCGGDGSADGATLPGDSWIVTNDGRVRIPNTVTAERLKRTSTFCSWCIAREARDVTSVSDIACAGVSSEKA